MKKTLLCIVLCILIFTRCKKETDTITTATIHGQVYNMCTDSGLVNCTVFLKQNGSNIAQMQSGAGGNVTFSNVQIHSSSSYTYDLEVQSNTAGGYKPDIDGNVVGIDKSKISQTLAIDVLPIADYWRLYFPSSITTAIYSDTFTLVIQQNIFHKNMPNGNYKITELICPCTPPPLLIF